VSNRTPFVVRGALHAVESVVYVIVAVLLVAGAVLTVISAVSGLVHASLDASGAVQSAVSLLDRVLLIFILTELLFTLRLVILRGEILAEPFLLIGVIAIVRRILVLTAQFEKGGITGSRLHDMLVELGVLGALVIALALAVVLLRRSAGGYDPQAES